MAQTINKVEYNDPRTGKTYASFVGDEKHRELVLEYIAQKAEYDYQMSLPPERRAIANRPTDFKCPFCKTKEEPAGRKVVMRAGFLFSHSWLEDVFKCRKCDREFSQNELQREIDSVRNQNYGALLVERYKSKEINAEQLEYSLKNLYSVPTR